MSSGDINKETNSNNPSTISDFEKVHKKSLEEDDEFEDFPIDTWPAEESLRDATNAQTNLWEEDWDDVEVDDDFTKELKAELAKYKQQNQ